MDVSASYSNLDNPSQRLSPKMIVGYVKLTVKADHLSIQNGQVCKRYPLGSGLFGAKTYAGLHCCHGYSVPLSSSLTFQLSKDKDALSLHCCLWK